jgi:uncharacterized protein YqeY
MLREKFTEALKTAMKARDERAVSAVRMILAKLKERDIEVRPKGLMDGIPDPEIVQMLQGMVKQRRESIELYEQGKRPELAQKERDEIGVIEAFMPKQLSEAEMAAAIKDAVAATGATSIKDMGKVMGALKARYAGTMDFGKAGSMVKAELGVS